MPRKNLKRAFHVGGRHVLTKSTFVRKRRRLLIVPREEFEEGVPSWWVLPVNAP